MLSCNLASKSFERHPRTRGDNFGAKEQPLVRTSRDRALVFVGRRRWSPHKFCLHVSLHRCDDGVLVKLIDENRCDAEGWMPEGVNQRPGDLATVRKRFGDWDPRYNRLNKLRAHPDATQDIQNARAYRKCTRVESERTPKFCAS